MYPHESDWSYIASITGDDSWQPGNMRRYFERLEDIQYQPPSLEGHGEEGWFGTTLPDPNLLVGDSKIMAFLTATANAFGAGIKGVLSTLEDLAKVIHPDLNSADPGRDNRETIYMFPNAVKAAQRSGPRNFIVDTANALKPDGSRKYHLDIRLNTLVTKVRFQYQRRAEPRAVGVDFLEGTSLYKADPRANGTSQGTPGQVDAKREVIISAGTFNTPQLLKLSGIGPKQELSSMGIETIVNLPGVGTNLQDRYEVGLIGETDSDFEIWNGCTFGLPPDQCLDRYATGAGPYAFNGLPFNFVKKTKAAAESDQPDLIVLGAPLPFNQ